MYQNTFEKVILFISRISIGIISAQMGYTFLTTQNWSSTNLFSGYSILQDLYVFLTSTEVANLLTISLPFLFIALGITMALGIFSKLTTYTLSTLFLLIYAADISIASPFQNSILVNQYLVYALFTILLRKQNSGYAFGLGQRYP